MNRLLWLVMLLLLIGTAIGASWAFNQSANPFAPAQTKASNEPEPPPPLVIALGLVDGAQRVTRPMILSQGRVVETAQEGAEVEKDAVLLKLDDTLANAQVEEAQAALADAQEKLSQAKNLPQQYKLKIQQQKQAIAAAEAKRKAGKADHDLKMEKYKKEFNPNPLVLEAAAEILKQLDALVDVEKAKLDEIKLFKPQSEINRAQADVNAKTAQLAKAQWALQQCTLRAPCDGLVLRISISPGEVLVPALPGQPPPVEFLPKGPKIVRAEVLQEWAYLVKVGQEVEIEDDTYQGPTWKGKVKYLSQWFAEKRNRIVEPFMINDVRTLECIIEVTQESPPLRIGQRVRAKIKTK